jgi:DNA replication protein DnaC
MAWRSESVELKALIKEHQEYHYRLDELKKTPVLYIDDLWKTQQGTKPTQADVNLAFEITNHRYQDKKYCTIISCEYTTDELMKIDEAVGSRIFERSKGYSLEIERDSAKNFRLRDN